ncbi:DUF4097 family beta strand repeat-containing protein [Nocardia jejuensis]|uniref:DUF4097 family beta strand repeat-containing protein n=1 Tax=Nocardia jejuensis TaxID=328049 RepID=UPI00082E0E76|nr:DUF4097 family beta strand repeat-containing protein [Nocardia jejuensis]
MTVLQTPNPITVTVDVLSASVTVIASERTDSVVEIRPADAAKKADVRAAAQTLVDFTAGALTVTTPKNWRTYTPFGGNPSIEILIEVPVGSLLESTAGVGKLVSVGEFGSTTLEVAAGDIVVESPRGAVSAKVAKGDIRVSDASNGELRLETSYGELEVGIRPGSAASLETNVKQGAVQNLMQPVGKDAEVVRVHARNSFGNIIVRHAVAA